MRAFFILIFFLSPLTLQAESPFGADFLTKTMPDLVESLKGSEENAETAKKDAEECKGENPPAKCQDPEKKNQDGKSQQDGNKIAEEAMEKQQKKLREGDKPQEPKSASNEPAPDASEPESSPASAENPEHPEIASELPEKSLAEKQQELGKQLIEDTSKNSEKVQGAEQQIANRADDVRANESTVKPPQQILEEQGYTPEQAAAKAKADTDAAVNNAKAIGQTNPSAEANAAADRLLAGKSTGTGALEDSAKVANSEVNGTFDTLEANAANDAKSSAYKQAVNDAALQQFAKEVQAGQGQYLTNDLTSSPSANASAAKQAGSQMSQALADTYSWMTGSPSTSSLSPTEASLGSPSTSLGSGSSSPEVSLGQPSSTPTGNSSVAAGSSGGAKAGTQATPVTSTRSTASTGSTSTITGTTASGATTFTNNGQSWSVASMSSYSTYYYDFLGKNGRAPYTYEVPASYGLIQR